MSDTHMIKGEVFMVGWAVVSLLPLLPLLLGFEFNVDHGRETGAFLWPREWISKIGVLAVGLSIPMFVDFTQDVFPSRIAYLNKMLMLSVGLLSGIALVVTAEDKEISDVRFAELLVCIKLVLTNATRGCALNFRYSPEASPHMRRTTTVYNAVTIGCFVHRVIGYYDASASPSSGKIRFAVEFLSQLYMSADCIRELNDPSAMNKADEYIFSLYFAIFGTSNILLWVIVAILTGTSNPGLVILAMYANVLSGFAFTGRRKRDKTSRVQELLASKRTFVRYIAHEMRTPLNVSMIGLQMAMKQLEKGNIAPPEKLFNFPLLVETLEDSSKAIEEAADTLNEMLTFDKIESGKFEIEPERLQIRYIIKSVYRSFFLPAKQKDLKYIIELPANLNYVFVMADKKKITQCLRNYISNAVKFTPEGGTVTVRAYLLPAAADEKQGRSLDGKAPQTLHVEVIDTGVGIETKNLKKIFREVVQFNAAKLQGGGGSGLGMTITKAIMDAHHGTVGVISEFGSGSTFYFEMAAEEDPSAAQGEIGTDKDDYVSKCIQAHISDDSICDMVNVNATNEADVKPDVRRVLVVDDSPLNLKMMNKLLRPFVAEIILAENGARAAELVAATKGCDASQSIDMVLTDYQMPLMDGLQLTSHLRDAGYSGFIALVTGMELNESDLMTRFYRNGGDVILKKPIRMADITRLVLSCSQAASNSADKEDDMRT
jgi:signal transduction histidine kinase/FixJ family two-component response regulator